VEIKRIDAPTLRRSMRIAPANLQPSGRAFRFNKLGANLFFSLCHSAPFASSKVFEPLLDARDLKWVCVMSKCHLTEIDPVAVFGERRVSGGQFRSVPMEIPRGAYRVPVDQTTTG